MYNNYYEKKRAYSVKSFFSVFSAPSLYFIYFSSLPSTFYIISSILFPCPKLIRVYTRNVFGLRHTLRDKTRKRTRFSWPFTNRSYRCRLCVILMRISEEHTHACTHISDRFISDTKEYFTLLVGLYEINVVRFFSRVYIYIFQKKKGKLFYIWSSIFFERISHLYEFMNLYIHTYIVKRICRKPFIIQYTIDT